MEKEIIKTPVADKINQLIKDQRKIFADHLEFNSKSIARNISESGNIGEPFISQSYFHQDVIDTLIEAQKKIIDIEIKRYETATNN